MDDGREEASEELEIREEVTVDTIVDGVVGTAVNEVAVETVDDAAVTKEGSTGDSGVRYPGRFLHRDASVTGERMPTRRTVDKKRMLKRSLPNVGTV